MVALAVVALAASGALVVFVLVVFLVARVGLVCTGHSEGLASLVVHGLSGLVVQVVRCGGAVLFWSFRVFLWIWVLWLLGLLWLCLFWLL